MEKIKKEWVLPEKLDSVFEDELANYDFEGNIDFSDTPFFIYDSKHHIVVKSDYKKVIINNKIINLNEKAFLFAESKRIKLSRTYGLHAFFDEHMTAKCIVFVKCKFSIFHEAYTIKVFIDE